MSKRIEYPNGFVGVASDKVAEIYQKRGMKILGDAKAPEPKPAKPARNRDAMVKEAIKLGVGTKEELLKLSDAEIAKLMGDE